MCTDPAVRELWGVREMIVRVASVLRIVDPHSVGEEFFVAIIPGSVEDLLQLEVM